ncbi:MAG: hypothetical protein OEM82_00445 [Acidobacteriota bacterium]|nr:hypothetical protein [Acidobacteriota bacterium]MDH3529002.1 hypothetical protein [Acidobacteriota bacterium]
MDPKSLLKNFWQLLSVARIAGLQALSIVLVAYAAGKAALLFGVRGCPPIGDILNLYMWLFGIVGIAATFVSFYFIVFPAIWSQRIDRQLLFSSTDTNLRFLSTQPFYVFLDAVFFIPAIALFQAGRSETMCAFNFEWVFGWVFLVMTFSYPLVRAVSWYVFGRRIEARKPDVPWPTLVMWWLIAVPLMVSVSYNYLNTKVYPKLRVPVVNEKTFAGGLSRHPDFMTGIVRVQGKLVREIAKCGLFGKDPEKFRYPSATVLLDMGKQNGQIIVKASRPRAVELLEHESQNKLGEVFEAFGRISKLPNPRKRLICGIGTVESEQNGGLALLEIELP